MNVECMNLSNADTARKIKRILAWTTEKSLFTWAQMPLPETAEVKFHQCMYAAYAQSIACYATTRMLATRGQEP